MKGKTARLLPLLHTLVEERAGERRFPTHPPPFMSQPWAVIDRRYSAKANWN
jgi:hypothetical protein